MPRYGFIRDKLDIKFLILYLMARVSAPIDFTTLTDLALCDEGVDYFLFAQSVSELTESNHLLQKDELYSITEKGRKNGAICEGGLPFSVRSKCDRSLAILNKRLQRDAQIRAEVLPRNDAGGYTVRMILEDDQGCLLNLDCFAASREQAQRLAVGFKTRPDHIYRTILDTLLEQSENG